MCRALKRESLSMRTIRAGTLVSGESRKQRQEGSALPHGEEKFGKGYVCEVIARRFRNDTLVRRNFKSARVPCSSAQRRLRRLGLSTLRETVFGIRAELKDVRRASCRVVTACKGHLKRFRPSACLAGYPSQVGSDGSTPPPD